MKMEFGNVGFEDRGKLQYLEEDLLEQGQEPGINSTHLRCEVQESNPQV